MSEHLKVLEHRQHQLKLQAHRERTEFAEHFEAWEKPLGPIRGLMRLTS